jgi:hypothetical protein
VPSRATGRPQPAARSPASAKPESESDLWDQHPAPTRLTVAAARAATKSRDSRPKQVCVDLSGIPGLRHDGVGGGSLEEHFNLTDFDVELPEYVHTDPWLRKEIQRKLLDLGAARLESMEGATPCPRTPASTKDSQSSSARRGPTPSRPQRTLCG